MLKLDATSRADFANAVAFAQGRSDVRDGVLRVYNALAREVARRRPVCTASGRCCRFDEYGHRLFVTTIETAVFLDGLSDHPPQAVPAPLAPPPAFTGSAGFSLTVLPVTHSDAGIVPASFARIPESHSTGGACPFLAYGRCSVHTIRPFGCRLFYCDETSTEWQSEQYELFHAELKRLHEAFTIPYRYVEWREALAAVGLSSSRPGSFTPMA
jgi:Fe-S-cluster containining protein